MSKCRGNNRGIEEAVRLAGSQRALGERLDLDQSTVSRYLANVHQPPAVLAARIEREYGVPLGLTRPDLFGEEVGRAG